MEMMSFKLLFLGVAMSNKSFISCTYDQMDKLNSNTGNEATIME